MIKGQQQFNDLFSILNQSTENENSIEVEADEEADDGDTILPVPPITPTAAQIAQQPPLPTIPPVAAPMTAPGTKASPKSPKIGTVIPRSGTIQAAQNSNGLSVPPVVNNAVQLTLSPEEYEKNLIELLNQGIALASHDRAMALSMLQVSLDRAEELDKLDLSMPVATAISDNTTACLKSMELAQKAGRTIFDSAKLLVDAKKADDTSIIKAFQARLAERKMTNDNDSGWGSEEDLPGGE